MSAPERLLRVVIVGHVDHGKSTMVGRLLHETDNLPAGRYEAVKAICDQDGKPFEYAFLLDALEEERLQGITIDTAQVWLRRPERDITLFDAPGHKEFVKNMVCGAAVADAALLTIDAAEGIREQSRRHGNLLRFLGVDQLVVVINKMDLVEWSYDRFREIEREYGTFLSGLGFGPTAFVPISAREGDNVTQRGEHMSWYRGPTVIEAMESFRLAPALVEQPLRLAVQDVYKFDERRILAGRVESGRLRVGDEVLFSPSEKRAVVKTIERWSSKNQEPVAYTGESIGFTLEDQIFVERGEVLSAVGDIPPVVTDVFKAKVFWMGKRPLVKGRTYTLKLLTREVTCEIESFEVILDASTLEPLGGEVDELPRNETAEVTLRCAKPVALDSYGNNRHSGRFVLVDQHDVCGGGTVGELVYPDQRGSLHPTVVSENITWDESTVTAEDRRTRAGHPGAVVWMTGLSGSGKSTLSRRLEKRLFERGVQVYRLDGDNVRHGLSADLGFSPDDRAENIRRVAEVSNLLATAGMVVITSFISPYRSDRKRAREIVKAGRFLEVFVDCAVEVCEQRDPKGLYKKARAGEIEGFTGVSAPYEKPVSAEIYVNTEDHAPEDVVETLLERLADFGVLAPAEAPQP